MSNFTSPEISIVIPIYNNEVCIKQLADRIENTCIECNGGNYELIFVDDGSTDNSWETVKQVSNQQVKGIKLSRNFGQHAALKAGFVTSKGKFIIMMDGDLEDKPELISKIYSVLSSGVDICYTGFSKHTSNKQRLTSKIFHFLVLATSKNTVGTNIGTFRGFSRKVCNAMLRYGERRPVYGPLITSLGFSHQVIEIDLNSKKQKKSSYTFAKRMNLAADYFAGYTSILSIFFLLSSLLSFLGTLSYAVIIIVQFLLIGNLLVDGFSLLIVLMLLLFSVLFFGMGIIGFYLQRIMNENLNRPLFLVAETTDQLLPICHNNFGEITNVRSD